MPDSNIMETLLFQLHYDSIAVSFIKVGSSFHPHSSAGYISYTDLLKFFSHSTMGTCLESSPDIVSNFAIMEITTRLSAKFLTLEARTVHAYEHLPRIIFIVVFS